MSVFSEQSSTRFPAVSTNIVSRVQVQKDFHAIAERSTATGEVVPLFKNGRLLHYIVPVEVYDKLIARPQYVVRHYVTPDEYVGVVADVSAELSKLLASHA